MKSYPKMARWESRPYRMFVASQECFCCGIEGYSQCAHENAGKAKGMKASDERTFPLCATRPGMLGCHVQHDLCLDTTRTMRDEDALIYVARMQARARKAGWVLPSPAAPGFDADARSDDKCDPCTRFFTNFSCGAIAHGECDCPKCQGYCKCETEEQT